MCCANAVGAVAWPSPPAHLPTLGDGSVSGELHTLTEAGTPLPDCSQVFWEWLLIERFWDEGDGFGVVGAAVDDAASVGFEDRAHGRHRTAAGQLGWVP